MSEEKNNLTPDQLLSLWDEVKSGEFELPETENLPNAKDIEDFIVGKKTWAELTNVTQNEIQTMATLGGELYQSGRYDDALKIFEGLLAANPKDPYLQNATGAVLQKCEQKEDALEHYSQAIKIDPDHIDAYVNRAELYWVEGERDLAEKDLAESKRIDPQGLTEAGKRAKKLLNVIQQINSLIEEK